MSLQTPEPRSPSVTPVESANESPHDADAAHRVAMLRTYLARFGLTHAETAEEAARRVLAAVARDDIAASELDQRLIMTARGWVREFAATSAERTPHDWFWRAPSLLGKFPTAFLSTPLPAAAELSPLQPEG
jgi:hypothetical protein